MGTPEFAVPSLEALAEANDVVAVVTQPDRPRGRGQSRAPSPVADTAERLGIRVLKPDDARDGSLHSELQALAPDLFAVVAFGAILTPALLSVPRLGSLNLHGSLLPHFRGASPVQRALWEGSTGTGVTTLWMDEGIDTGDVVLQEWEPIEPDDNAGTLAARLATLGAPLLAESVRLAQEGRAPRRSQERGAGSYAKKLSKKDGVVDWSLDAVTVWNRQRAVTPWPGAATSFQGRHLLLRRTRPAFTLTVDEPFGTVLEVSESGVIVSCGTGALRVISLVSEGRGEQLAAEWARGARIQAGQRLEQPREAHV